MTPLARENGSPVSVCLNEFARKLTELNTRHLATGGRAPLHLEDMTWRERALDLHHRVGLVWLEVENGERPSMDRVLEVGASSLAVALALGAEDIRGV